MERKEELKILIESLAKQLHNSYAILHFEDVEDFIKRYSKVKAVEKQLDDYINELNTLS